MDHRAEKRENYRRAFHQFDPVRVAAMDEEDIERLVLDAGIIRHRGKIQAIIGNARAFLAMEKMANLSQISSGHSSIITPR